MDIDNGIVYLNKDEKRALAGKDLPDPLTAADVQERIVGWLEEAGAAIDDLRDRHALDEDSAVGLEVARAENDRNALIGMAGTLLAFEVEQSLS